jgi:hypothetical protein
VNEKKKKEKKKKEKAFFLILHKDYSWISFFLVEFPNNESSVRFQSSQQDV